MIYITLACTYVTTYTFYSVNHTYVRVHVGTCNHTCTCMQPLTWRSSLPCSASDPTNTWDTHEVTRTYTHKYVSALHSTYATKFLWNRQLGWVIHTNASLVIKGHITCTLHTPLARLCCIAIWKLQYSSPSVSMYTATGFGNIHVCVCSIAEPYMTKLPFKLCTGEHAPG